MDTSPFFLDSRFRKNDGNTMAQYDEEIICHTKGALGDCPSLKLTTAYTTRPDAAGDTAPNEGVRLPPKRDYKKNATLKVAFFL